MILIIPRLEETMHCHREDCTEANRGRMFHHNGHDREIDGIEYSDETIAHTVRMLMRDDWHHEAKVCMARDRILCLIAEKEALKKRVEELERQTTT